MGTTALVALLDALARRLAREAALDPATLAARTPQIPAWFVRGRPGSRPRRGPTPARSPGPGCPRRGRHPTTPHPTSLS